MSSTKLFYSLKMEYEPTLLSVYWEISVSPKGVLCNEYNGNINKKIILNYNYTSTYIIFINTVFVLFTRYLYLL